MKYKDLCKFDALLSDIDGTAVDSEPVIREVIEEISLAAGYEVKPEDWDILAGLGDKGVWKKIVEWAPEFTKTFPTGEAFENARLDRYVERIGEVQAHESVKATVEMFIANGKDVCAVTNAPPRVAEPHLVNTGYPRDKMGLITETCAHDRGLPSKPHPAMYDMAYHRTALERLDRGVTEEFKRINCLVLEDSPTGVKAGLRAGMTVIQLTDMCGEMDAEIVADLESKHGGKYIPMTFNELAQALTPDALAMSALDKAPQVGVGCTPN